MCQAPMAHRAVEEGPVVVVARHNFRGFFKALRPSSDEVVRTPVIRQPRLVPRLAGIDGLIIHGGDKPHPESKEGRLDPGCAGVDVNSRRVTAEHARDELHPRGPGLRVRSDEDVAAARLKPLA